MSSIKVLHTIRECSQFRTGVLYAQYSMFALAYPTFSVEGNFLHAVLFTSILLII